MAAALENSRCGFLRKGNVKVPVDDRVKCFYLIEDLTVSKTAGFWAAAAVHGGGSPEIERKAIPADYDQEAKNTGKKIGADLLRMDGTSWS